MRRWLIGLLVAVSTLMVLAPTSWAYIQKLMSLKEVIEDHADYIFVAKVERIDPQRPAMVLTVAEHLKGKAPYERLPINLTGDKDSDKDKHVPKLLKRVAPDLPMIVFVNKASPDKPMALAYTNGTWLQLLGYADGEKVTWAFTHCEIYLRRTYRGTTDELKNVLTAALTKKKRPPPPDAKVAPGFGPELTQKEEKK
jgi:hypothetical protein